MDITHIVVGTDFSPEAEVAVKHAVHIARRTGAEITLVHACPVVAPPARTLATQWTALMQHNLSESRKKLEELCTSVSGQGARVSHLIGDDVPDAAIIDAAAELGAELIIVGTRGLTGAQHLLLGSVAEKVIRKSKVSVMVARPAGRLGGGYRHILVPTDFSDHAEHALDAATLIAADGAHIDVWHWWHGPYGGPLPDPESLRQEIENSVRSAGEELLERYRSPRYRLSFATAEAPPKFGIQHRLTSSGDYDLVIVGSHGRRAVARWLVGSVAEATARHAPCSVLVARAPAARE